MARGRCLNILVVLAAVRVLLGLPSRCARSLPSTTTLSPSLIGHLAFVDVKQNVNFTAASNGIEHAELINVPVVHIIIYDPSLGSLMFYYAFLRLSKVYKQGS